MKQRPSKAKAKEMLHNPPGGKFASDKQRRYFAYLANKQMGGDIDPNGYLESNLNNYSDQKIIPGGNITTQGMAFPIMANGQPLYPNTGDYQFDSPYVVEEPMYQKGGPTRGDSLALMNNTRSLQNYYKNYKKQETLEKIPTSTLEIEQDIDRGNFLSNESILTHKGHSNPTLNEYYQKVDDNRYFQRESASGILDIRSPMPLYDRRISPTMRYTYDNVNEKDRLKGDNVIFYGYDPIQVTPYDLLTPEQKVVRDQRYPKSKQNPQNKKPSPLIPDPKAATPLGRDNTNPVSNVQAGKVQGQTIPTQTGPYTISWPTFENAHSQETRYFQDPATWKTVMGAFGTPQSSQEGAKYGSALYNARPQYQYGGPKINDLMPRPSFRFFNNPNPTRVDSLRYQKYFDAAFGNPIKAEKLMDSLAATGKPFLYGENPDFNAAEDAYINDLNYTQAQKRELGRLFFMPKDIKAPKTKHQQGGTLDDALIQSNSYGSDPRLQQGKNYDKNAWAMYDNTSYFIENGGNPLQTPNRMGQAFLQNYGQQGRDALTGVSIFNQDPSNAGLSPEARLRKFYSQQQTNPELERLRLMGATTTDPYGAYKRSNNVAAQGQYSAVTASLGMGGKYRYGNASKK